MSARSAIRRVSTAALVALAVVVGCARNPVTGERELALISESQEIQMGQQGAQEVVQSIGLVKDEALQQYVQRLGAQLAEDSERPGLPWTFRVVDDPVPNAFALPGGYIFVTRGLLALMNSEAELVSVLGHEIGHVTARHSVQQLSRQQLAQLGLGLGSVLSPEIAQLSGIASQGLQLLFLRYGREAEYQADDLGFRYALENDYDVREMSDVFAALARASQASGQSPLPTWLSTHPYPEDRIERNQQRLARVTQSYESLTSDRAAYLQRIRGLTYGENPRNGFFENGVFYHPDLRFRLAFPDGWRTQNLPQAVVAMSPQEDAMVQLTLAGQTAPAQALQQFLAQQGVQAGQATTQSINGNPAAVATFQAQTQQGGTLQGYAAYIQHRGATYQLLTYGAAQRFGSYDQLFRGVIGSFADLTDQRALSVQPRTLQLVTLDRAMTLAEFNQRYPSVVPIEELALINAVESAGTRLEAGRVVKRVVAG